MTVAELIEALTLLPGDLPVWHDGGGDGVLSDEIESAYVVEWPAGTYRPARVPPVRVELS